MRILRRKIWRDLWHNRLRTLLVMLSIAVGIFALGLVFGVAQQMRAQLSVSHQESVPPHVILYTDLVQLDTIESLRDAPGVTDAAGAFETTFHWKLEGETTWRKGTAIARHDYTAQRMYVIDKLEGEWPERRTLAVERMSAQHFGLPVGTTIVVDLGQREVNLPITGLVRHPYTDPPQIGLGNATFCVTPDTAAWLTRSARGFNAINVRLEAGQDALQAAARLERRLERADVLTWFYEIVDDDVHWAQEQVDAVFLVLSVLGMLSLALSGFLIVNTMNATVTQQMWQIGVMKVIGGTFWRLFRLYLTLVLIYGGLSLLIAIPLGVVATHLLTRKLLDIFNILLPSFAIIPQAIVIQVSLGLVVPVLAAAFPIINGARITPHQAIRSHGMGGAFGSSWFDRLLGNIRRLPRPLALSLRNTFRRKGRVTLTLLALVCAAVIFVMVLSVSASFDTTVDAALREFGHDVVLMLDRQRRVAHLIEIAGRVPGMARAEVWETYVAELGLDGGEEKQVSLWGVPTDSLLFNPRIVAGETLVPGDARVILLNNKIAVDEGLGVGDTVTLNIDGTKSTWTVKGLVLSISDDTTNYIPFDILSREIGTVNRGSVVLVRGERHDAETQHRLAEALRAAYAARHVKIEFMETAEDMKRDNKAEFRVILYLMLVMAILAAVVGGVGLTSTMSINVVERAREIGMMRAIGASSPAVVGIFVAEGVFIGVLSWLLAIPCSYPGALLFSRAVGVKAINVALDFTYSYAGAGLWLVIVLVLSALASLWPAMQATRVSVREALAYE